MNTVQSALFEIEQQLTRGFALVSAARGALLESGVDPRSLPVALLDMADDELSSTNAVHILKERCGTDELAAFDCRKGS